MCIHLSWFFKGLTVFPESISLAISELAVIVAGDKDSDVEACLLQYYKYFEGWWKSTKTVKFIVLENLHVGAGLSEPTLSDAWKQQKNPMCPTFMYIW